MLVQLTNDTVFDIVEHELFIEQDPIRNRALEQIINFYKSEKPAS